MESIAREYSGKADFYILYGREAHPGENYPAHKSLSEKLKNANDLQRIEDVGRTILVDSVEGTVHRAYGSRPNSVFVIGKDGIVLFRAEWNAPAEVKAQLNRLLEKGGYAAELEAVNLNGNFTPATPEVLLEHYRVFKRAGYSALVDFAVSSWNLMRRRSARPTYTRIPNTRPDISQLRP